MRSQTDDLLAYLRTYGSVTPLQALQDLGIYRLGARVYDLRQEGYAITTEPLTIGQGRRRKTVARYVLTNDQLRMAL